MTLSDDRLAAIRSRVAETTTAYTALGSTPSQMAQDREHLLTEVERLDAELARRDHADAESLADQTLMKGLTVEDGAATLSLIPPREIAAIWVHCARGMLGDAPNYTETPVTMPSASMEVGLAGEPERFALIVQRVGNLTPHQARERAEAEVGRLAAELAAIRARAHARSEELLNARDARPHHDKVRRSSYEYAAHEVRNIVRPPAGEASDG